jgi:high-affinity iron transporter
MIGALIIVFREVIEAGLIVGIVLAATRGLAGRALPIGGGVVGGVAGACVVAAFAGLISNAFEGAGAELLNASILLFAVCMLTWHNVWMARHGSQLAADTRAVSNDIASGRRPLIALALVVGLAVLREGSEVVLFLYGVVLAAGDSASTIALGGVLGLVAGVAVAGFSYVGLIAIPARYLFRVTGILIALLAAGMASQAMGYLRAGGFVEALGTQLWDTSALVPQSSIAGRILQTLIGYSAAPTALQLVAYLTTLAGIYVLMRFFSAPLRARTAARP